MKLLNKINNNESKRKSDLNNVGESICHFLNLLELENINLLDPWIFSVLTLLAFHSEPILWHACIFRKIYSIFTI